ncbi:cell division protein PerM [Micrococcoides hystricis]|uniref:DUF6350 family protein n=1 Tax=Micrococcoides hystricis TaxID=1572761 RepID=A0ABV6PBZ5_9MICC
MFGKTSRSATDKAPAKLRRGLRSWRNTDGTIPLPLWLQGVIEALIVAAIIGVFALLGPLAVLIGGGIAGAELVDLGIWWAQNWLVLHGVPLHIHLADLPANTLGSTATPGSFHVWPMTVIAVLLWLSARAGKRLARASRPQKLYLPILGALGGYALISTIAWLASYHDISSANWISAIFIPLLIFGIGVGLGALLQYNGLRGAWERYGEARFERLGQRARWQLAYLWAVLRSGIVVALGLVAAASLVFAIQLGTHWIDVVNLQQELNLGLSGAIALAGIDLTLLVNFIVWTLAWVTGAGFSLGEGSTVSLFETAVGPTPAFPLLGVVPPQTSGWMWLVLLLPVLAGAIGGWWFIREGENHVDEALDVRVHQRWMSLTASTLLYGVLVAAFLWLILVPVYAMSGVDLGVGRLHGLGPAPLTAALWGAGIGAAGAMIGYLLGPMASELKNRYFPERARRTPTRPSAATINADASAPETATAHESSAAPKPQSIWAERPLDEESSSAKTASAEASTTKPAQPDPATPAKASKPKPAAGVGRLIRPRRKPTTKPEPPRSISVERELPND